MKASKELINHLSSSLWNVPQSQIESVLNGFDGNPIEETPPQRDWTGVRFKIRTGEVYELEFIGNWEYKIKGYSFDKCTQDDVNNFFANGIWIEIHKEENLIIDATIDGLVHVVSKQRREAIQQSVDVVTTIHVEKPRDPLNLFDMEKRLKAAEDTIDLLSRDKENLWVAVKALEAAIFGSKQNLDIQDWKTVECLSWNELQGFIKTEFLSDVHELIKSKLCK